jgi:hypothetical protein
MTYLTKSIASRIEWCRQQSTQARAPREREGWEAEEAGLRDALFNRDHTTQYQQGPPAVFERYALGLQDGHALLRTAAVYRHFAPFTRTAGTGRNAGRYGMGDVSTRPIMGLTRRGETSWQECRVTGHDNK